MIASAVQSRNVLALVCTAVVESDVIVWKKLLTVRINCFNIKYSCILFTGQIMHFCFILKTVAKLLL
jgi:hypothetical protein